MAYRLKVGILMGGKSSEHDVSLETGKNIIRHMPEEFEALPIRLTRDNDWIFRGKQSTPEEALLEVDLIFNAMHGEFGEDGRMQSLLERFHVPYTGSGPSACHLAMNKVASKKIFQRYHIPVPRYQIVSAFEKNSLRNVSERVLASLKGPWIVKPANRGSSIGVSLVKDPRDIGETIKNALDIDHTVIVEDYIPGKEITCSVIEAFPTKGVHSLPLTEIRPKSGSMFFDFKAKYSPDTEEITPAPLSRGANDLVQYLAKRAHTALGCKGYSRADFILTGDNAYLLEVNALPGMTAQSLFPKTARAAGVPFEELVRHLITHAIA